MELRRTTEQASEHQAGLVGTGLMLALALLGGSWLWIPAPGENQCRRSCCISKWTAGPMAWSAGSPNHGGAADARAIVDHMATLHKKNTLCPAHKALEGRPNMYIHFRTEDSYQVVALQVGGGQRRGVSYPRDGGGLALAAQVLQPQDLEAYVLAQIHGALSGESL
ncbi:MAG: hypothetical protein ACLSF6_07955 [Evtepia gabavorous]